MIYLLNCPILTCYGDWKFQGPVSIGDAKALLQDGFISGLGHEGAAQFLSALLSMNLAVNRIQIEMRPGDGALVIRLRERLPEGTILTADEMQGIPYELGILWLIH